MTQQAWQMNRISNSAIHTLSSSVLLPVLQLWRFEALRRVPILFNLSEAQLLHLAKRMTPRSIAAGEVVFHKSDTGHCCSGCVLIRSIAGTPITKCLTEFCGRMANSTLMKSL